MELFRYCLIGLLLPLIAFAKSVVNPIEAKITSSTNIPSFTTVGSRYSVTYSITSNLPFNMPTPFENSQKIIGAANEFTTNDLCHHIALEHGKSCSITINLNPSTQGSKSIIINLKYGNNVVPLTVATSTKSWDGLVGVDYNPNHYPNGNAFNNQDIFFTGTANGVAISNVYAELSQLQAAGFTTVRSYQVAAYSWIDIINQASTLGMKVVYEAVIPFNGSQTDITAAITTLNQVIASVTATKFSNTVTLVFAGHENYDGSNITYLKNAVTQLQAALTTNGVTNVPVGSALVSGNLVTPGSPSDMQTLINAYSANAPLGFDPYPFQWGVTPPDQAASNVALLNSIAWDYAQVITQSFYVSPRSIYNGRNWLGNQWCWNL